MRPDRETNRLRTSPRLFFRNGTDGPAENRRVSTPREVPGRTYMITRRCTRESS